MSGPTHFAVTARQLIDNLKPEGTDMTTTNHRGHGQHQPEHDPDLDGTFCIHDDQEWPCGAVETLQAQTDNGRVTTDQPADLDAIRRALTHYDETGSDDVAHDLVADLPALLAEVERLRAENEFLRNEAKSIYDTCKQIERERDTALEVTRSNRDKTRILTAVVDAAYAFADQMEREGVGTAIGYARHLRLALDAATPAA